MRIALETGLVYGGSPHRPDRVVVGRGEGDPRQARPVGSLVETGVAEDGRVLVDVPPSLDGPLGPASSGLGPDARREDPVVVEVVEADRETPLRDGAPLTVIEVLGHVVVDKGLRPLVAGDGPGPLLVQVPGLRAARDPVRDVEPLDPHMRRGLEWVRPQGLVLPHVATPGVAVANTVVDG